MNQLPGLWGHKPNRASNFPTTTDSPPVLINRNKAFSAYGFNLTVGFYLCRLQPEAAPEKM